MEFKYTQHHDGIIEEEKFASKQAKNFPLWWVGKYPAEEGGDCVIETVSKGPSKISVSTDPDFQYFEIKISCSHPYQSTYDGSKFKDKVQAFLDELVKEIG